MKLIILKGMSFVYNQTTDILLFYFKELIIWDFVSLKNKSKIQNIALCWRFKESINM